MSPIYRCYLEAAQTGISVFQYPVTSAPAITFRSLCHLLTCKEHEAKASDRFLMTSKKQSGNKTSSYLISCDQGADDRGKFVRLSVFHCICHT